MNARAMRLVKLPKQRGKPKLDATIPYFGYGSNMDRDQMSLRAPGARPICWARLKGWQLEFRGVANVAEAEGKSVLGSLWLLTEADLRALDCYEGYPYSYGRDVMTVETPRGPTQAIVYMMNGRADDRLSPPPGSYLAGIRRGYRDLQLPEADLNAAVGRARAHQTTRRIKRTNQTSRQAAFFPVEREPDMQHCEECECYFDAYYLEPGQPDYVCGLCWQAAFNE